MINNNPYNIPEKKPLSQSNIYSDTNTSRHSSTYMQNRGNNEIMYNSSIFMKNSSVMNGQCDQSFFEPIREPLSPHSKYSKPSSNIQFVPTYNNGLIRQPETNLFPISTPKDINGQKGLNQLKEKIERIEKRIQAQEKKQNLSSQLQNKKVNIIPENEFKRLIVQQNLNNSTVLKELVNSIVQESIETQNKKIWQRMRDLDESISFSSNHVSSEKLSKMEDSFFKSQSEKIHDEQLMNRIKTIEKTIRQMGEDIHLVNDKEENLSNKIQNELPWIRNQIKTLKLVDKRIEEFGIANDQLRGQIQQILSKINSLQTTTQLTFLNKIKEVQAKVESLNTQKRFKPSFDRYFSEPIILKYLQKFQISGNNTSKHSHTNSTKGESCEEILINEITYFIDPEGYILDNDRFYLITGIKNQRVRLDLKHLQLLRERKILI